MGPLIHNIPQSSLMLSSIHDVFRGSLAILYALMCDTSNVSMSLPWMLLQSNGRYKWGLHSLGGLTYTISICWTKTKWDIEYFVWQRQCDSWAWSQQWSSFLSPPSFGLTEPLGVDSLSLSACVQFVWLCCLAWPLALSHSCWQQYRESRVKHHNTPLPPTTPYPDHSTYQPPPTQHAHCPYITAWQTPSEALWERVRTHTHTHRINH